MDRKQYTVEYFLQNPDFRRWVLHPEANANAYWQQWLKEHPNQLTGLEEAREIVLMVEKEPSAISPSSTEVQWQRLKKSLPRKATSVKNVPNVWLKVAAAISTIMLFSLSAHWWLARDAVHFATDYGQIETITLPDGSTVALNANSQLEYQENASHREVWLQGEGFFEVVHTSDDKKFIVHTRGPEVEVLGTAFYVNNRQKQVKVVLNSGRVTVRSEDQAMNMVPGELVAYREDTQQLSKQITNPEQYSAWKDNMLVFDRAPLSEIAQLLEDRYGYSVKFRNQVVGQEAFTGTFPADRIHVLLTTLEKSVPMTTEKRQIVFGNP